MSGFDLWLLTAEPPIFTDADGRHFDEQGREYDAVDVDGEIAYVLTVPA